MTALVYLRSSFGFTLLRPRSIFFGLSVFVGALDFVVWSDPEWWREYRAACIFSAGAIVLYWLHFAITFAREIGQTRDRERDDYSGKSYGLLVLERIGFAGPQAEANVHIWLEPAAVLLCAATLRYVFAEQHLSAWLVFVAACIFAKESLNYWTARRRGNIAEDIKEEAEDRGEALGGGQPSPKAPKAARVAEPAMKRNVVLTREEERAIRLAKILGLTEPYDLDEAEANYRERIQLTHPDTHGNSAESTQRSAELNEAIEFFRKKLGG